MLQAAIVSGEFIRVTHTEALRRLNIHFYPLNHEARNRIQSGQIGEPRILQSEYCQDWLLLPTDWNWRLIVKEGDQLHLVGDIGTYGKETLSGLTGHKITEVMADMFTFFPIPKRLLDSDVTFSD